MKESDLTEIILKMRAVRFSLNLLKVNTLQTPQSETRFD